MDVTTKTVDADITPIETGINVDPHGEFEVILSTDALDRDGERLYADEWKTPLPFKIHFDSDHGMSVEKTVGSGEPRINDDGQLVVRGTYAGTQHAQMVRQLVKEGHITSTSVTFRTEKTSKDASRPRRELLNGTFCAVPANPEAVVLLSKSAKGDDGKTPYGPKSEVTYGDPGYQDDGKARYPLDTEAHVRSAISYIGQSSNAGKYSPDELKKIKGRIRAAAAKFGIEMADDDKKSLEPALTKQLDASGDNPAESPKHDDMVQAIHDAAAHLGAQCTTRAQADSGESEGANKAFTGTPDTIVTAINAYQKSSSPQAGLPQDSADESTAATTTAHKAAVVAAADDSAERAVLRAKALAFLIAQNTQEE